MADKTVVLCEGRHDLIFLSLLLERAGRGVLPKNWDQICRRSSKTPEQRIITDFLGPRERMSILVKQDKDRDTCIHHFWMLYKSPDERYSLRMVLDSDNGVTLRNLKREMMRATQKDLLNYYSTCIFPLKSDTESGIFLYPTTLTEAVLEVTGKNLNQYHDGDSQKRVLEAFLEEEIEWVRELERFLM